MPTTVKKKQDYLAPAPSKGELAVVPSEPLRDAQDFMGVLGEMIQTTASIAKDASVDKRERIVAAKVAGDLCMGAVRTAELAHELIAKERRRANEDFDPQRLYDFRGDRREDAFQAIEYAEASQTLMRHARRAGLQVSAEEK